MPRLLGPGLLAIGLALAACGIRPAPTPGLVIVPLPTASTPKDEALAVVAAEAEAVRQQDIDTLAALWLPDGIAVDANHTPTDDSDDRVWQGWEEIRERYVQEVFPHVAAPATVPRPQVSLPEASVTDGRAEIVIAGPDGRTPQDRWLLRRQEGSWRIERLTFNLTPR